MRWWQLPAASALSLVVSAAAVSPPSEPGPCGEAFVDGRDGRRYPTVSIGGQCWMGSNLDHGRETMDARPRDPHAVEKTCYGNESDSCRVYGGLYTWDEATQGDRTPGGRGACPSGWHLPTRAEWERLDVADALGLAAQPAGSAFRGSFGRQGEWALFWTSTEQDALRAVSVQLDRLRHPEPPSYRAMIVDDSHLKENAFSVRCVRDGENPASTGRESEHDPAAAGDRRAVRDAEHPPASRTPVRDQSRRPNILCIVCEDISPLLGSYGDPVARTPTLDRLARDGVRFTRMFSVSGVCAPSRAALITGMYPTAIGADHMRTSHEGVPGIAPYEVVPPPHVRPYVEILRAAGYYTTNNAKTDYQFRAPITTWDENGPSAHWRHRPEGMPFFSIVNLETTHESQVWARANDPVVVVPEAVTPPPYLPDTDVARRDIARVYSNVAVMDRQVGEILRELDDAGLADETFVIFYSDNGGPLPRQKRQVLDSGLHVPFLMRFPGRGHAGEVVSDPVSFVDIPATILSLAGIPAPEWMQGQPFWGPHKAAPREYVFAARDRLDTEYDAQRAVRDRRFKYIRNYKPQRPAYLDVAYRLQMPIMRELLRLRDEQALDPVQARWFSSPRPEEELYDTLVDPHEIHDLARDPAYRTQLERLRDVLERWVGENGDDPLRPERDLVESMWPGGVQPKTAVPAMAWRQGRVEIECATPGAAVAYQVDGRGFGPDHWLLYVGPFEARTGSTITATAIRVGYAQSPTVSFTVP